MLGLSLDTGEQLRQDALDEYTAKTKIEFDLIPTPGTSAEQLPLVLDLFHRAAKTPDVYVIDGTWPGTLGEHLLDLAPFLTEESRRHAKPLLQNNTVGGRLIALPLYMSGGMLFYRRDLLKKYGYSSPPRTWKELDSMALRIQNAERQTGNSDFWGYIWQGGPYEGLTCNALEWQSSFGGGKIVENDGTVSINNPRAAAALKTAAKWVGTISPKSVIAYTEADTSNVFRAGNAAFMRHWTSAYQSIRGTMEPESIGIALLPAGPAGRAMTIGGFQLAVSRYSQHAREAADLVLYLTSPEVQARRAIRRGFLPTYPELHRRSDVARALPPASVFAAAPPASWTFRPASATASNYPEVTKVYFEKVHELLAGKIPAERALVEIEQRVKSLPRTNDRRIER